jgi:hypothetical protein
MITHGTPPVAEGGWSEFIKDFGIGLLLGSLHDGRRFTPADFLVAA